MTKYFLPILLMLSVNVVSQPSVYYPFPESNAQWNMQATLMGIPGPPLVEMYSIIIPGDTMINSTVYHKLVIPYVAIAVKSPDIIVYAGYQGAIRQDIQNRKVFIIPPDSVAEELLYDFTLQAGDTVKGCIERNVVVKDVVRSIDSVLVGDNYRKRWLINEGYNIYFIEGIGSTYGLVESSPGTVVDWADISITCFQQEGITLYPSGATECSLISSLPQPVADTPRFSIYPNPSAGSFTISFDKPEDVREIKLTDMHGRIVFQETTVTHPDITVNNIAPGLYLITIVDKNNVISCRRVLNY
jgi:hypothetical protein